jgi:parvulin-like peptidyl-prolyl isomerase
LLPAKFDNARRPEVSARLGDEATDEIFSLSPGRWAGPLSSPFGLHLIYVEQVTPGRVPELADVRDAVERDWLADRRATAEAQILDDLRRRYTVTIETPADGE